LVIQETSPRQRPLRFRALHARHDGNHLESGLNDRSVAGLAAATKNERFAMTLPPLRSDVLDRVMEMSKEDLEHRLRAMKDRLGVKEDTAVPAAGGKTGRRIQIPFPGKTGKNFPDDPMTSFGSDWRVFGSWMAEKAVTYRRVEKITAFSAPPSTSADGVRQYRDHSGTGVCFTRDPSTGEKIFYGDYLVNAQGKMSLPASALPCRCAKWPRPCPRFTRNSRKFE